MGGTINLPFLGVFQVDGGKARFNGTSFLPYLDVTAESSIANYQVFLRWQGDLKDPPRQPVTLSSNPPLASSDILRLLQGRQPVAGGPALSGQLNPFSNAIAGGGATRRWCSRCYRRWDTSLPCPDVSMETVTPNLYSVKMAPRAGPRRNVSSSPSPASSGQVSRPGRGASTVSEGFTPGVGFFIRAATGDLGAYSFLFQYNHSY